MDNRKLVIVILLVFITCRLSWIILQKIFVKEAVAPEVVVSSVVEETIIPEKTINALNENGVISFKIFQPMNFNDKTKQDIYDIRRMNVGNSPLYPENYTPSDDVFGQIVSGKPWYGKFDRPCDAGSSSITRGESLLSTAINNPNALISPFAYSKSKDFSLGSDYCQSNDAILFLPSKIEYTPHKKMLEITYPINEVIIGHNRYNKKISLLLMALNARDAGYNYITATGFQGGFFYDTSWDNRPYDSIMKIVYNFHDYIHLGTSCGLPGGCNNISPWQEPLSFALNARPAKIQLKLWKNEPTSRNSVPDLYCNLIFE